MLEVLRGTTLVGAAATMGLMAGLFCAFAISVMPGLHRSDAISRHGQRAGPGRT